MDTWTNRQTLRRQYAAAANLATRVSMYEHLVGDDTGGRSFEEWVLDRVAWSGGEAVLDVGRGAGAYEAALQARAGWAVGLDLSPGMLAHPGALDPPRRVAADAQWLPVAAGSFDVVLAAHMLYHVPDIQQALRELRRALRPGGTALLVGNGVDDKVEIRDLWREAVAAVGPASFPMPGWAGRFVVDAGHDAIRPVFPDLRVDMLRGEFRFPTPAPVMAWANSLRDGTEEVISTAAWQAVADDLEARIQRRINRDGVFVVRKASGVIVAR